MRKKRLNIYNTDNVFNLTLVTRDKEEFTQVTKRNEDKVRENIAKQEKQSKKLKVRDDNSYVIYTELLQDDKLVRDVFEYGGFTTYYAEGNIPYHIIKLLNENRKNSRTMIPVKSSYSYEEVQNVVHASMASTVVLDMPVVYSETNPYRLIMGMSDIRYRVDIVEVSFPPLRQEEIALKPTLTKYYKKKGDLYYLSAERKYEFFTKIRNACSHWKINIMLVVDNDDDMEALEKLKAKDMTGRKGSATW